MKGYSCLIHRSSVMNVGYNIQRSFQIDWSYFTVTTVNVPVT